MPKTSFITRPTKKGGAKIQLFFNYGKERRLRYSTGLSIKDLKSWNTDTMRVRNVQTEPLRVQINNTLNSFTDAIEKEFLKLSVTENVVIDNEVLKNFCDLYFNKKTKSQEALPPSLLEHYEWFLKNYSIKPLPSTGKPLGRGTLKTYRNAFTILKRFNSEVYRINYDRITLQFYDDFLEWLYEQDYSVNYIGTQIKILKTVMNNALEKDYHTSKDFLKSYFKKPSEEIHNIFLDEEELNHLFSLNLEDFEDVRVNNNFLITRAKLDQARDLFLLGCWTGLRVGDFSQLKPNNIIEANGDAFIQVIVKKSKKPLTIPIHPMVKQILDKNGGMPPNRMPAQHINYCLKELGKAAGFNELIEKSITKGGKKLTTVYEKHQLLVSHTARRSFCTNCYMAEMPVADIMAISNHKSEAVFYNYIKVGHLERARRIGKHIFFQEKVENFNLA